jgi:hypothetical protein
MFRNNLLAQQKAVLIRALEYERDTLREVLKSKESPEDEADLIIVDDALTELMG